MAPLETFIRELQADGMQLWVRGGRLRYRSSSGELCPAREAEIRRRKTEIIELLEQAPESAAEPLAGQRRPAMLPLSYAQEGLWFLEQLGPPRSAYNLRAIVRIEGNLDVKVLRRALEEIEARHEILRTRYRTVDGVATQVIDPPGQVRLLITDLALLGPEDKQERHGERLRAHRDHRFDLERECPFLVELLSLGPSVHVLLLTMHHLMMDGASIGIFFDELEALYGAYLDGYPSPLAELPAQYADYALWQRGWLRGDRLERHLSYWKSQLRDAPETIQLPVDRARPKMPTFEGDVVTFSIASALEASLNAFAREQGLTMFMLLLGSFHALLSRWSRQKDLCIGLPVDARSHPDAERLIGLFSNTVVFRANLSYDPTVKELFGRVRSSLLEAYEHRDLAFDRLVAELRPDRRLEHHPLVQVMFTYLGQDELQLPGLSLTRIEPDDRTAKFDLLLCVSATPTGLEGTFEFSSDLFERESVERLVGCFVALLEGVVAGSGGRVGALPLLGEGERRRLLVEFNATGEGARVEGCLHELFEQRAAVVPDAVAVVCGGRSLSYGELERAANRLAHRLRELGVGPERLVAICVERSVEMVVGLLAILKAGGGYVPLDPGYPRARLEYMLADSGARVVVTQAALVDALGDHQAELVCVDDLGAFAGYSAADPDGGAGPSNLAYCIYTSGSTGQPKGVVLTHANATALLDWAGRVFDAWDWRRVLCSTSICFDLSVFELFVPLVAGGSVVLVEDALSLGETDAAPTLVNTVPSAARALVETGTLPGSVKTINLAGEPLHRDLVRRLREAAPGARVHNLYGPTEYTTYATYCQVDGHTDVTIGRPLTNTQVYVLDEHLEPVPIGVTGEIHIAGPGLARGYWDRPELTAERFIPNPFDAEPGARMYRTGDLGRYRPTGEIEFHGRVDHQIKLRGFRIELGEIETALVDHPAVTAAAVQTRAEWLVAYVVAQPGTSEADLRDHLQNSLPDYMVPTAFVFLDGLPFTPNGKLDRHALPAPDDPHDQHTDYIAARTPTEGLLAEIWSNVLNVEQIGIHDNFFALGGHSLLATQVVARIRGAFRCDLPLRQIFVTPTIAELATHLATAHTTTHDPIPPAPSSTPPTPSFAQQRMWFLDQLEPHSPLYNIPVAWRLRGDLDISALERALNEIIRRHETLRTVFQSESGDPTTVVLEHEPLNLAVADLSAAESSEPDALVLMEEEARKTFELARGPVFRTSLIRLGATEHILLITLHHVVADGWSLDVLLGELAQLYGAYTDGRPNPLPELPIQYSDFAAWQRDRLQGPTLAQHIAFWDHYLHDAPPHLDLPTDHPRPAVPTYRGGTVSFDLSLELSERLRQLSRRCGVTLFMTMAAAFNLLLHRYSRQDDICIGYQVGNRDRVEIEGLIGVFVNTLVLRTRVTPQDTFESVLEQVRESMLEADQHKELPFEKLVEELRPDRDLSRHPIFQVTYGFSTTHGSRSESTTTLPGLGQRTVTLPGLDISLVEPEYETAKFDLLLFISDTGTGHVLEGDFEFSSDLFERESVERLVGCFVALLEGVVAGSGGRVGALPLLGEGERRRLLVEFNATGEGARVEGCLHELFEQRAAVVPDAVAVVCGGRSLSYGELERAANRLAHRLRELGVGPERLVAICVERSVEMVVGLLAILKAGGGYVPLDPGYPRARLEYMLADSGARVVVTQAALVDALGDHQAELVCVDDLGAFAGYSAADPDGGAGPSNLAYCIYTSGSTGQPKGVVLTHANATALLDWAGRVFDAWDWRRVLCSTSICFDLSVFELFVPLVAGGSVVLVEDALSLGETDAAPTLVNTVPSAARALVETGTLPGSVKTINLAGEPLHRDLVRRLREAAPGARVHNLYGPTEYTTYATYCQVDGHTDVTIGRPLTNTQVYVLDEHLEPVPIGVTGEIHIAGPGLARGYWDRPELTAERFIPNPFDAEPGARMYRTGDLGRYRPTGEIEFHGRVDHQIKLRGFRIELGEIETALVDHPAVTAAAVQTRAEWLVAYVVAQPGTSEADLRDHLQNSLPDYMVPTAFVFLDGLPFTPNGKLDRHALPAPDDPHDQHTDYIAARTPTEGLLAEIWSNVLNVEQIGIHDNFFALGGHSLLATQVVARIRGAFRCDLPLRQIFVTPTIAELATHLATAHTTTHDPIPPAPSSTPPTPSFAQQRMWFLDQLEPHSPLYNIPVAWRLRGDLDISALERALNEIIRRHETLRTAFAPVDGSPVPVVAQEVQVTLVVVEPAPGPDQEVEIRTIVQEEGGRGFDLATGPLVRARLIRLGDEDAVLLLTVHHIVADGWSLDVLLGELAQLYGAYTDSRPNPLPELPIQYSDFAAWQRDRLQGPTLAQHIAFWDHYLHDAPPHLDLPTDHPRPPRFSYRGAWVGFDLAPELARGVQELSRRCESTAFMTLAAAFGLLLHRHSRQDDICIGYPVANRDRAELEPLIGVFVNTLVLRLRIDPHDTFVTLVDKVRDSVLDASAHHDLPFEKLVEELNPERDPSRQPLVQAAISVLDQGGLELPGLEVEPMQPFDRTSKFDLTLFVSDTRGCLSGGFEYATDLFERDTIERIVARLATVLEAVTADPDARLSNLSIVPEDECRMIAEWNDTAAALPADECVHESVERHAEADPGALALACGDRSLTYGELNARANQLAHQLRALGVGPETLVATCVERSVEMVVALLGILKAGAAYVPLDPAFPRARLAQMLADCDAPVVLTQAALRDDLPENGRRLLSLDADWREVARRPMTNPAREAGPLNLAYCIYTSGSTGTPKAVGVTHRGLLNLTAWHRRAYDVTPADRTTQVAGQAFDACAWEVWTALCAGASLHLADDETRHAPPQLATWLGREEITLSFLPTPLAEAVIADGGPGAGRLRALLTGGDTLHRRPADRAAVRLVNHYGPTEGSVVATSGDVEPESEMAGLPSIGHPIDNTRVHVLDARGEPVPVGVVGELYLSGAGVARGYLKRPALTAERFVPDPFSADPGARMYRTGDLGRHLPSGQIELAGRADQQVKVRGFRIELREVEAVLAAHADVRECVVDIAGDAPYGPQLVAYVVAAPGAGTDAGSLRRYMKDRLPEPMVPSLFVPLTTLPLTPNGKVDRRALPAPDAAAAFGYVAPRTPVERSLVRIWQRLLEMDRVGIRDDFFACGGQSLLAVTALSRIRDELGVEVRLRSLFDRPTIADLADHVETLMWLKHGPDPAAACAESHGTCGEI